MKRYLIEIIIIVIISASYDFAAYQRNFVWKDDLSLKKAGKLRSGMAPCRKVAEAVIRRFGDKNNMHRHRLELMVCLFLIVATLAVYCQVRNHDFVNYDDNHYVTDNRHVQNGLTWEGTIWAFTATHASNWHPLTWLSHILDCQI